MPSSNSSQPQFDRIRAIYEEYDVGPTRVATIADPDNGHAWIQSTVTAVIEP